VWLLKAAFTGSCSYRKTGPLLCGAEDDYGVKHCKKGKKNGLLMKKRNLVLSPQEAFVF